MVVSNRYRLANAKMLPGQSMQEFVAYVVSIINELKAAGIKFDDDTELCTWVLNGLPSTYDHEKMYLPRDGRKMKNIGLLLVDLYQREAALLNADNENQISEVSHTLLHMSVRDTNMHPKWEAPKAGHLREGVQGASTSTGGNGGKWASNQGWSVKPPLVCWFCHKEGHKQAQCPLKNKRGVQQYKGKGPKGQKRKDRDDDHGRAGGDKKHKGSVRFSSKPAPKRDGSKPRAA